MRLRIYTCVGVSALIASCGVGDNPSTTIDVSHNALGVTSIETTRVMDDGNSVFTLHALAADRQELGFVRLTIGVIPDLSQLLPGTDAGSEIVVSVGGNDLRTVTHETELFHLVPTASLPDQLLALPEVTSTLAHEANILVVAGAADPMGEAAFSIVGSTACAASQLLTTPTAAQCCYTNYGPHNYTIFVNPSKQVVTRFRNGNQGGCVASDGLSACSGAACYYGPYGYARPQLASFGSNPIIANYTDVAPYAGDTYCAGTATGTVYWGNKTGTEVTGRGCPGSDGGGGNGAWDY